VKTHDEMIGAWKKDPAFRKAYDALEAEFILFDELLTARSRAGLTQAEVAERMGTKTPAVARLEAGGGSKKHSPSIATLRKYAAAVGCHLEVKLVPFPQSVERKKAVPTESRRASLTAARPIARHREMRSA
jgi:transcriptional regulator with XRE-family HTH domain